MSASEAPLVGHFAESRLAGRPSMLINEVCRMADRDVDLIERIAAGDASAYMLVQPEVHRAFEQVWARLVHQFKDLKGDQADLLQSLEMHLVRNEYRVLRTFRGDARLSTWLHAVAMRHVRREAIKLSKRRQRERGPVDTDHVDPATDPEVRAVRASQRREVQRTLQALSEDERCLVAMFYEQGLDASQVATCLGISPAGVRMRKKRLLARLQDKLKGAR